MATPGNIANIATGLSMHTCAVQELTDTEAAVQVCTASLQYMCDMYEQFELLLW